MGNENFKYAYFALIKANVDNEYNEAMVQFILYVIKKKHYDEIDIETLCKDFEKIIGFVIPYFLMKKLLNEALKDGFIEYTKDKKYIPNFGKIDKFRYNILYFYNHLCGFRSCNLDSFRKIGLLFLIYLFSSCFSDYFKLYVFCNNWTKF